MLNLLRGTKCGCRIKKWCKNLCRDKKDEDYLQGEHKQKPNLIMFRTFGTSGVQLFMYKEHKQFVAIILLSVSLFKSN